MRIINHFVISNMIKIHVNRPHPAKGPVPYYEVFYIPPARIKRDPPIVLQKDLDPNYVSVKYHRIAPYNLLQT